MNNYLINIDCGNLYIIVEKCRIQVYKQLCGQVINN